MEIIMSEFTTEQKLQLVQQVRSRYRQDRCDMFSREQILYGKSEMPLREEYAEESFGNSPGERRKSSSLRLRLMFAACLLGTVVFMDVKKIEIGGITADKIFRVISADYEAVLEKWALELSDTFVQKP